MKKLLISILLIPTLLIADAVIFSGNDVKALKQNLDLFGVVKVMSGGVDPSAGAGVAAPVGSAYLSTNGTLYLKTGVTNTDWTQNAILPIDLTTQVTGVLPILNGGTGSSTQNFVDLTTAQNIGGIKTFDDDIVVVGSTTLDTGLTGPVKASAGVISTGNIDLTSEVTGVLPILNGGTGSSTQNFVDLTNNQSISGAKTFTNIVTDPANYEVLTASDLQDNLDEIDRGLLGARATGIEYGGALTNLGSGIFRIASGHGNVLDNTAPMSPTYSEVDWVQTDIDLSAETLLSYVRVNSAGVVSYTTTAPTHEDYRLYIWLHRINPVTGNSTPIPMPIQQSAAQIWDVWKALGSIKKDLDVSAASTDLTVAVSSGEAYQAGANFFTSAINPHEVDFAAKVPATFRLVRQNNASSGDVTVLDVANYDLAGTVTAIPGATTRAQIWTVRMFIGNGGTVRIFYGQNYYNSTAEAFAALRDGTYNPTFPAAYSEALTLGYIITQKGATNLADGVQIFVNTNKYGLLGGAISSGGALETLQFVYDNSATPQITTNTTNGSVDIKRGSAADTDKVFRTQNGAGVESFSITGAGAVSASSTLNVASSITAGSYNNKLSAFNATTSSELAGVISDETGTGSAVFSTTPTLTTPVIGAATGTSLALGGALTAGTMFSASSTTQAMIGPRLTTTQKNAITPVAGMEAYDSTLNIKQYYNGTQWVANTSIQLDNVYSAKVSSASVVSAENKNWLNGNCTFGSPVASQYNCPAVAGTFTVTPNCFGSANSSRFVVFDQVNSTSTNIVMGVMNVASAFVSDTAFSFACEKQGADYQSADAYIASNSNFGWTSYTPTFTGFGTPSLTQFEYKREGDSLYIRGKFTQSSGGTATESRISLPSSLTIAAIPSIKVAGSFYRHIASSASSIGNILTEPSVTYLTFSGYLVSASDGITKQNGNVNFPDAATYSFVSGPIQISGWTNSNLIVASLAGTPNVPGLTTAVDTFSVSYGTTNTATACSGSPCFIDQIGTAVSSVTRSGAGQYTLNTARSYAKLACTGSAPSRMHGRIVCSNCSGGSFTTENSGAATADAFGTLNCVGGY